MNWDEDIDLLAQRKSAPRQGRRAGMTHSPDTQELSLDSDVGAIGVDPPVAVRVRKTGHWGDEGTKSARKSSTNLIEQERFQDSRREDSDDDIPVIPDIDDIQDELSLHSAVKKPMVSVNKATYKELDSELGNLQKKIANLGNVNLSFLTTHLYHEEDVKDVDELWTMEDLFETLISCNK